MEMASLLQGADEVDKGVTYGDSGGAVLYHTVYGYLAGVRYLPGTSAAPLAIFS